MVAILFQACAASCYCYSGELQQWRKGNEDCYGGNVKYSSIACVWLLCKTIEQQPLKCKGSTRNNCSASLLTHHDFWLTSMYQPPTRITIALRMMQSTASYTCRRCLGSIRQTRQAPLIQSVGGHNAQFRMTLARRSITTLNSDVNQTQKSSIKRSDHVESNISGRRLVSTVVKNTLSTNEPQSPPGLASTAAPESTGRELLLPNNLFHSFSNSPSPEIRRRAAFIKQNAYCPHPDHRQTRLANDPDDPEARKQVTGHLAPAHVNFECPDCGIPISCSEEHYYEDYEAHMEICDTLKEINEDDHDLRSGRFFPEFEYPADQIEEAMVNMTNWDTFLYSRDFRAINDERSLRQATRLLTYPVTIGSILHELSPYNIKQGGRLTTEGLKSLSGMYDGQIHHIIY